MTNREPFERLDPYLSFGHSFFLNLILSQKNNHRATVKRLSTLNDNTKTFMPNLVVGGLRAAVNLPCKSSDRVLQYLRALGSCVLISLSQDGVRGSRYLLYLRISILC